MDSCLCRSRQHQQIGRSLLRNRHLGCHDGDPTVLPSGPDPADVREVQTSDPSPLGPTWSAHAISALLSETQSKNVPPHQKTRTIFHCWTMDNGMTRQQDNT